MLSPPCDWMYGMRVSMRMTCIRTWKAVQGRLKSRMGVVSAVSGSAIRSIF